jgi:hypothetical protein
MIAALALVAATPAGAHDVVVRYYRLIEARDYPAAYRLWDRGGAASGKAEAAFARGFAHTRHVAAQIGAPGRVEGAAGSTYAFVTVDVRATLDDGTRQHFVGRYVVRRSNVAADGRWRLYSARLRAA